MHVFTVEFTYQILTINFNSKLYISCYYTYWSPMVRYFRFVFLSSHFLIRYTITRNLITREARCCRSLKKKEKKEREKLDIIIALSLASDLNWPLYMYVHVWDVGKKMWQNFIISYIQLHHATRVMIHPLVILAILSRDL